MSTHCQLNVNSVSCAYGFYQSHLALGYTRMYMNAGGAGWGRTVGREFSEIKKRIDHATPPSSGFHLTIHANKQNEVDEFYREALLNGGSDNGAPGPRPDYGLSYYAAFVIDPAGYELEVKLYV